jgi:hypothetical protein
MSQAVIEAGIIATIKLHADFDDTNCFIYDKRALGKGLARLVIVTYAQMRREPVSLKIERRIWTYNVDVLVPWRGELSELDTRVGTETQKVIDILAKYPRLNGAANVQRTDMTLSSIPDVVSHRKGVYRGRRHALDVREIFDPQRAE